MSATGSGFHAARWNEALINELSEAGARGIVPPAVDAEIAATVGDVAAKLPAGARHSSAALERSPDEGSRVSDSLANSGGNTHRLIR